MEYLLGIVVSLLVETSKKYFNTNTAGTYFLLLVVSVIGASVYYFLARSSYWPSILQILTIAAAFHNLVIRQLNSSNQ